MTAEAFNVETRNALRYAAKVFSGAQFPKGFRRAVDERIGLEYAVLPNGNILKFDLKGGFPIYRVMFVSEGRVSIVDEDRDLSHLVARHTS